MLPVLAAVDVDYRDREAVAGAVTFAAWTDASPISEHVAHTSLTAPYVPGELWRRELPPILDVLARLTTPPSCIVVDAYVWLPDGRAGLGAHLHDALGGATPVVGVAKSRLRGDTQSESVLRGQSRNPLYVTAVGIDPADAARAIESMHGRFRVPALLRRVDRLCREA